MSQIIRLVACRQSELSAGLRGFTEDIEIKFDGGGWDFDADDIGFLMKSFADLLDATVVRREEFDADLKKQNELEEKAIAGSEVRP